MKTIALGLLLLTGCSYVDKIKAITEDLQVVSAQVRVVMDSVKSADVDHDGKLSAEELGAWIAAGGGAAIIALWQAFRRIGKGDEEVKEKLSSAKKDLWSTVGPLKEEVAAMKAVEEAQN